MKASNAAMSALMLTIFTSMTAIAALYYPEGARFQPLVIGIAAVLLCVLQLMLDLRGNAVSPAVPTAPIAGPPSAEEAPPLPANELRVWTWFLALIAGVLLLGFWITIPLFLIAFLRFEAGTGWQLAIGLGAGATAALYGLFGLLLRASLHEGFLLQWIKG